MPTLWLFTGLLLPRGHIYFMTGMPSSNPYKGSFYFLRTTHNLTFRNLYVVIISDFCLSHPFHEDYSLVSLFSLLKNKIENMELLIISIT